MTTGPAWGTPDGTAPDDATPAWGTPDSAAPGTPDRVTLTAGPGFLGPFTAAVYELFSFPVPGRKYLVGLVGVSLLAKAAPNVAENVTHGADLVLVLTAVLLVLGLVVKPLLLTFRPSVWTVTSRGVVLDPSWDHRGRTVTIGTVRLPWSDVRRAILTDQSLALVTKKGRAHAIALRGAVPSDIDMVAPGG